MRISNFAKTRFATLAGTVLLGSVTVLAQHGGGGGGGQSSPAPTQTNPIGQTADMATQTGGPSYVDRSFVDKALKGGVAEVALGQLALQKTNNSDLRDFAQKMIDDHTRLNDAMKPMASKLGVKVPDGPSKKDKANLAKMQALSGDAFDQAYIKDMLKDHKSDLSDFQSEIKDGTDPAVKDAATQGSQIISQHLQMIQQISQKTGTTASK